MNSKEGKQKLFVIYQITNLLDNRIYIGAHATYNVNDKYMGSSKYLKKNMKELGRYNFKKEILHIFDNKEDMMSKEAEIVNREFCHRPDTYNKHIGGYDTSVWEGMIVVKDKENNIHSIYSDDPRYLSGELVGIMKGSNVSAGKFHAKDKDGNSFFIDKNDERWLSGELVGHTKGHKILNHCWDGRSHKQESKIAIGQANSIKQSGSGNSQFGTCWITKEGENKKIKKEELEVYLSDNWIKGRKQS